ncbi:hypothetical protein ACFYTF_29250 [Nocardia thailandica]|uniref:DUF222 domain-containing protein n=1 Tax=Nocardia thailandica TaxID=257275 RepID=A0ABW6PWY0_9NOCA
MTDHHLFITDDERLEIIDALREVPDLIERLALAIVRGDRHGLTDATTRRAPQSTPPIDYAAQALAEEVHAELTGWVRVVCEERALRTPPLYSIIEAARWLDLNATALAMSEAAPEAHRAICAVVRRLQQRLRRDDGGLTEADIEAANRQVLTSYQVDRIVPLLGHLGEGLNRRRVELLSKAGVLRPASVDRDTGTRFFRLGAILKAHAAHPRRGTVA